MIVSDKYRSPHVSEVDEPRWDDCRVCSTLMLVSAWTHGSVVTNPSGEPFTQTQRKRLREQMRNTLGVDAQFGGLGPEHAKAMVENTWPWLPALPQPKLTFTELWGKLQNGWSASVSGNPAEVKKPDSPLRRWTLNDDFGHEVFAMRANDTHVLIYDPLAPYEVNSREWRGQWVDKLHFKQFLYLGANDMVTACAVVKIGDWAPEEMTKRATEAVYKERLQFYKKRVAELEAGEGDADAAYLAGQEDALVAMERTIAEVRA